MAETQDIPPEDFVDTEDEPEDMDISDQEEEEEDMDFAPMEAIISSALMTEEGDTVCNALVNISKQLEMHNKLMVKMLTILQKRT